MRVSISMIEHALDVNAMGRKEGNAVLFLFAHPLTVLLWCGAMLLAAREWHSMCDRTHRRHYSLANRVARFIGRTTATTTQMDGPCSFPTRPSDVCSSALHFDRFQFQWEKYT